MFQQCRMRAVYAAGAVALFGAAGAASAQVNIANGRPVVAASGSYNDGTGDFGFDETNVTDGQNATPDNNTGAITEPGQDGSYWLAPEGSTTGYVVIDLGTAQQIGSFQIFNTGNSVHKDSGTGDFRITASNSLTDVNGAASSGTQLASGRLTDQTASGTTAPLTPDTFASTNPTTAFQYVRFDALNIGSAGSDARVGLNELRVFQVPEPTGLALLGLGGLGLLARRRRGA